MKHNLFIDFGIAAAELALFIVPMRLFGVSGLWYIIPFPAYVVLLVWFNIKVLYPRIFEG